MAKFDVRELNYITCGKKQNTFNIGYSYTDDGHIGDDIQNRPILSTLRTTTFFGDIGEYSTMSQKFNSNKCSFYDIDNKMIVHNLYDTTKSLLKTTAKKYSSNLLAKRENIDMFAPPMSSDFINICQFENYAYGLTKMTNKAPVILSVVMNNRSNFDFTYHCSLSNDTIGTFLCPKPEEVWSTFNHITSYDELILNAGQELSNTIISTIFNVKRDLKNIQHNYVIEIPESKMYNEYYKGYIQCDMMVAKNHLDYSYSMNMDEMFNLSSCREYCDINVCGNQLYMTYRDNLDYKSDAYGGVTYVDVDEDTGYDKSISVYNMTPVRKPYGYQHVEVIYSWNRWDGSANAGHKSSMFSLRLIDTGLNESTIDEEAKMKLRENIQKNVRAIIESITPANCQLFDIYFEGK